MNFPFWYTIFFLFLPVERNSKKYKKENKEFFHHSGLKHKNKKVSNIASYFFDLYNGTVEQASPNKIDFTSGCNFFTKIV